MPRRGSKEPTRKTRATSKLRLLYGKSLLNKGEVGAAIFVLEPRVIAGTASPELRETYAKALLAANRLTEAEPLIWLMYEHNPLRLPEVMNLIGALIDAQQDADAVALARKLEQSQRRRGERKSFAARNAGHRRPASGFAGSSGVHGRAVQ